MLACAQFGAQVIGSDIDFLMVHARTKPSRVGQKKRIKGESFKGNFEQYTLTAKLLDVIVADASNNPWRDNFKFDAIGKLNLLFMQYSRSRPLKRRLGTVEAKAGCCF